ncbi:MAG: hypothetical protein IKA52_04040 [Bacteroidaceae bacterium]|nr:hypothetical protein [Bacteroidaceae bacterium]
MKSFVKLLVSITLVMFAASCKHDDSLPLTKETFAGTWEYTIEISFEGTNYDTGQSISETKRLSGTFTWDERLNGWLEGDIQYSYLIGYLDEEWLGFTEDKFTWSENGKEYAAFCPWQSVAVNNKTKDFTTENGKWASVTVKYPDGSEIYCSNVDATFRARKIK